MTEEEFGAELDAVFDRFSYEMMTSIKTKEEIGFPNGHAKRKSLLLKMFAREAEQHRAIEILKQLRKYYFGHLLAGVKYVKAFNLDRDHSLRQAFLTLFNNTEAIDSEAFLLGQTKVDGNKPVLRSYKEGQRYYLLLISYDKIRISIKFKEDNNPGDTIPRELFEEFESFNGIKFEERYFCDVICLDLTHNHLQFRLDIDEGIRKEDFVSRKNRFLGWSGDLLGLSIKSTRGVNFFPKISGCYYDPEFGSIREHKSDMDGVARPARDRFEGRDLRKDKVQIASERAADEFRIYQLTI